MRVNVDRVLERDQKLSDLDSRAGEILVIWFLPVLCFLLMAQAVYSLLQFVL